MALSFEDSLNTAQEEGATSNNSNELESASVSVAANSLSSSNAVAVAYASSNSTWVQKSGSKYYSDYSDDNISTINDVKGVIVNDKQVNITQEKNSQFIPFEMDRYYDGYDLIQTTIQIYYVNADNQGNIANAVNVMYNDSKIRFGWLIDDFATAKAGKLKFEIQAVGVNSKGEGYIWKTKPYENLNVIQSLTSNGGIVKPDDDWITEFLTQVQEQVANAQSYANQAQTYASNASTYASNAATSATQAANTVSTAKTELESTVQTAVDTKVNTAMSNYYTKSDVYTKTEVDTLIENVDISEELTSVINDTDAKIKVVQDDLNAYKKTTDADLQSIHTSIDDLPTTLATDYYTKTDSDTKFATKTEVNTISTNVSGMTSSISANTSNIETLSDTVSALQAAVNGIDTSPSLTYDVAYNDEEVGENVFAFYEIENEGDAGEVKTIKKQFTIVGGSGGGATSSTLKIEYVTTSPVVATVNDSVVIKYNFSGTDSSGDAVPEGNATWKVGGRVVATNLAVAGENSFDITDYISIGTQKVNLTIADDAGSIVTKNWTVQKIDVRLESTFNDKLTYPVGAVSFTYTPYGAIEKTVHFVLDGKEIGTFVTSSSGIPITYDIPAQTHGAHLFEIYMTAEINGKAIESNHIVKDIIWYDATSEVPVISCVQQEFTARQYDATNITYTVYDPTTETPTVSLAVDGVVVSTLTLSTNTNTWQYKSSDVGQHTLTITCGDTVKTLVATITELGIDITPITAGLAFDFNPVGYSNNDANRLWSYGDSGISMTVSDNFDWTNGGYVIDDNGDQCFCIKAGTSANINYELFGDDAKVSGKQFKLIFKTDNVANGDATFLSCVSDTMGTDKVGIEMKAHEATIYAKTDSLPLPYAEEEIIEFEFNITPSTETPSMVMGYEDGVSTRPLVYDATHDFQQHKDYRKTISLGSNDCDLYIYRFKVYSNSLSDRNILNNFIADARNAEEMIDRYERNQIYQDGILTPEHLAEVCPQLRIIKIEAPRFTQDKKDVVKDTTIECIYKNGDPILDNWKAYDCCHSGRT